MSVSEVLRAAQARIDTPEKWWQRGGGNPNGTCAYLALCVVIREHDWRAVVCEDPAFDVLARAIGVPHWSLIPGWNDSHTWAEVYAAFSEAIAIAEALEQEFRVVPVRDPEAVTTA